jgi:hypothetical protein
MAIVRPHPWPRDVARHWKHLQARRVCLCGNDKGLPAGLPKGHHQGLHSDHQVEKLSYQVRITHLAAHFLRQERISRPHDEG